MVLLKLSFNYLDICYIISVDLKYFIQILTQKKGYSNSPKVLWPCLSKQKPKCKSKHKPNYTKTI